MESVNKEKSVVEAYLEQNKGEAQKQVNVGVAASRPAPLGRRTLAFVVDRLILFIASTYLLRPIYRLILFVASTYLLHSIFTLIHSFIFITLLINLMAELFYAGYFYSTHFSTPGKMIFNLQVLKDSGAKLDFIEAGLRDSVGKLVSGLILSIGYWMAFFRSDRHALHDLMFKTKVVLKN